MRPHRYLAVTLLFLLIALPIPGRVVADDSIPVITVDTLSQRAGSPVQVAFHAETGKVRFVGTDLEHPIPQPAPLLPGATPETAARQFLAAYGSLFGLEDQAKELQMMEVQTADRGRVFVRLQQVSGGIPVLGGELIVQLSADKDVLSVNGEVLPEVAAAVAPTIPSTVAAAIGQTAVAKDTGLPAEALRVTQPELWYYSPELLGAPGPQITALVWRMEVEAVELRPVKDLVLVDAQRGVVALRFSEIDTGLYRKIYDNNNNPAVGLPGTGPVRIEGQGATGVADVDLAYDYAGDVYNFYLNNHGRDSLDGAGMQFISTVRYCDPTAACPYVNAFWNGDQMVYGQGFSAADDVVGHEMTHTVTDFESHLFYYMQSGAINESLSDIWGEFIDLTNGRGNDSPSVRWLMGEDVPGGAIRSMSNPPAYNDPDRIGSSNFWCDPRDNGGVHINSGVLNKATYLMTDGGAFNGKTVSGLGITKVAKIFYEVQTHLLTSAGDYLDLYNGLQQACTNLTGTSGITAADCQQVKNAVDAVEMSQQPGGCAVTEAPVCAAGQVPTSLFFDDLETPSSGRWTKTALSGSNTWYYPQNPNPYQDQGWDPTYATSGVINMWGDDTNTVSDAVIGMTSGVSIPGGKPVYLRFNHAYDFETDVDTGTIYDGSVVEYSTDGSNWLDASALFTHNGYRGTISSSYSNPLGGRQGFGNRSWGYLSSRLSLNSLAGQNVRFRFRVASDSSGGALGWWIDDVRIYTCAAAVIAPDISITKRLASTNPKPGDPISFILSIANGGNAAASQIVIADLVPSQVTNLSYSSTLPVTQAGGAAYTWNLASLAAGASGTITINGTLSSNLSPGFAFVNTATISAPNDSNSANNSSSVTVGGRKVFLPLIMLRWPPIPDAPVLNPINNTDGDGNYTVSWNPATGANSYTLQEDDNSTFSSPAVVVDHVASTSWAASGRTCGTNYYRVKATNGFGDSAWSNVRSVVVTQCPSGPNPGFWQESDGVVKFNVSADGQRVENFAVYVTLPGCGTGWLTRLAPASISGNGFSFTGTFYASGTFQSSTSASGTLGLDNFCVSGCGCYDGGPFPWTASWVHSAQVTAKDAVQLDFTEQAGIETPFKATKVP